MMRNALVALFALSSAFSGLQPQVGAETTISVDFDAAEGALSGDDQRFFRTTASEAAQLVRSHFPEFATAVRIRVLVGERDLGALGGVTGQADAPGEVMIAISSTFPGGVAGAMRAGLRSVLLHEFHHLARGWTIRENQFGPGIPTAAVNEGLAAVFADTYSGRLFEGYEYPEDVGDWLDEILELPVDANYNTWMNQHPDGRMAVGYRVGRYVVHQAMERSGQDILELSRLPPGEILAMVAQ